MANKNPQSPSNKPSPATVVSPSNSNNNHNNQNPQSPSKKKGPRGGKKYSRGGGGRAHGNKQAFDEDNNHMARGFSSSAAAAAAAVTRVYSCCGVTFHIHCVYQQSGGDLVVVHTVGLQDCGLHFVGGFPELVVWDVPSCKVEQVCRVFQFAAHQLEDHRLVKGGEIVESDDLVLETKWIACATMKARMVARFPFLSGMSNPSCKWLALQPQFPITEDPHLARPYPMGWGGRPLAPRGQTKLRDRIVENLMTLLVAGAATRGGGGVAPGKSSLETPTLLWHVDANPHNLSFANLQQVTMFEAFCNPTWCIDWRSVLNGDEAMISYVKDNMQHFALLFHPRNGKVFTLFDEANIRFQYYYHDYQQQQHSSSSSSFHSPMYSPADSSMLQSGGNSSSTNNNSKKSGYLNLNSPEFRPGKIQLSLPEVPPFGF